MSKVKSDYKVGDSISVIKAGMFQGLSGSILSNNTETIFKPLSVILHKDLGTWQFSYADVEPLGKDKLKGDHKIIEPNSENKIDNLEVVTKPAKRGYKKRDKNKPIKEDKPKRKYTKKTA